MEKKSIYLVWQTDRWLSNNSKALAYIGDCWEDIMHEAKELFGLTDDEFNELNENAQIRRENDGVFIEEQVINAVYNGF
jgi:uncharacterized protein CbrC (UPF0167 family)